jgi:hypothetical protein
MFRLLEAIFRLNIKECIYIYVYIYIYSMYVYIYTHTHTHIKIKQSITDLEGPRGFQEVETPRFEDNRHKV